MLRFLRKLYFFVSYTSVFLVFYKCFPRLLFPVFFHFSASVRLAWLFLSFLVLHKCFSCLFSFFKRFSFLLNFSTNVLDIRRVFWIVSVICFSVQMDVTCVVVEGATFDSESLNFLNRDVDSFKK